jgi:hypothetical protein
LRAKPKSEYGDRHTESKAGAIAPAFEKPRLAQQMMELTQSDPVKSQKLHPKIFLLNNCRVLRDMLQLKS